LCHYVTHADMADFQPMKANFGILPPLEKIGQKMGKRERGKAYADRAMVDLETYLSDFHVSSSPKEANIEISKVWRPWIP